jgi:hypothetical protein
VLCWHSYVFPINIVMDIRVIITLKHKDLDCPFYSTSIVQVFYIFFNNAYTHILPYRNCVSIGIYITWKATNVKLIRYQFWRTRCAFRLIKSLQWYSGLKSWKSENNWENCKRAEKTQILCHEMNQICRRIELCIREIILPFEMKL